MVMDKGLSVAETENFLSISHTHVDIVKLGFGTAYVTPMNILIEKIKIYQSYHLPIFLGGTLFEAHVIRNQFDQYLSLCKHLDIKYMEVSDGSIQISHTDKCNYISMLAKEGTVLSEVGSKDPTCIFTSHQWIQAIKEELEAGSSYVITEARESGTVGIYRENGKAREDLIEDIITNISPEKIIWEAPQKSQQIYFIEQLGCNVNLGNIAPNEVISLEAMRMGLRADTFNSFFPPAQKNE